MPDTIHNGNGGIYQKKNTTFVILKDRRYIHIYIEIKIYNTTIMETQVYKKNACTLLRYDPTSSLGRGSSTQQWRLNL